MRQLFWVGIGSFLGGVFRYMTSLLLSQKVTTGFPYATFSVNLIGCLLIGLIYGLFDKNIINNDWRLFLATGICGGFTTFSAFSYESLELIKGGNLLTAVIYVASSIVCGLLLTYVGYQLVKVS